MTSYVKCPDFVVKNSDGELLEIRCKVCGTPIAGMVERIREVTRSSDGSRQRDIIKQWTRFHNYVELKMSLMGGLYHITHGCSKCMTPSLTSEELNALMEADIEEQSGQLDRELYIELRARVPTGIVAIKPGGEIQ